MHCGHWAGLTPPAWQIKPDRHKRHAEIQRQAWADWRRLCVALQPIYDVYLIGDLIDGRGDKSGSTELVTTDRIEQCDMAIQNAKMLNPTNGYMITFGTPYHTGQLEDFERLIADRLSAPIGDHHWPQVNGVTFDIKHKIGGTSTPTGGDIALRKERLWNVLWDERGMAPKSDIILRAHVHSHRYIGENGWMAATCPSLQYWTKYGGRQCSGMVDWGILVFDIEENGEWSWESHIRSARSARAKASVR